MPRKLPFRPGNEISQVYPDGIVTVFRLTDSAAPGYRPRATPEPVAVLRYEEQRLGVTRYYAAKQAGAEVERVLRVPAGPPVAAQDLAVTEDGAEYQIDLVQTVPGVFPASLDLTLSRVSLRRVPVTAEGAKPEEGAG